MILLLAIQLPATCAANPLEVIGISVTPHNQSAAMRWRQPPTADLAARVELFLQNRSDATRILGRDDRLSFDGMSPEELLASSAWSWHDTPRSWLAESTSLPAGAMTVLAFNGMSAAWGVDSEHRVQLGELESPLPFNLRSPEAWLSAVTFLSVNADGQPTDAIAPNRIVIHVANGGSRRLEITSLRMWLPAPDGSFHVFFPQRDCRELNLFPAAGGIEGSGRGGCFVDVEPLPLTYAVVELRVRFDGHDEQSLWSHLRIKREVFDISGGWVASDVNGRNSLTIEEYLKTLQQLHINTGQIEEVGGYTDNAELYERYPIKRFNRLQPLTRYDTDAMLPQIHAVEFLGEPQYGGGRPVPPQEVWEQLAPYQSSRLPTTVTLSEERNWRYYAGLSDYPHYDAYRVIAPAADAWRNYDRWGGERIRWGAPLETIGDMTRSLRELNRPRPIAYWSQGAHSGWGGPFSPRRGSPTPDELRSQAWQGLANRVTSLYWFNLSLKSLLKFPDLMQPIQRVDREIRLVDEILLAGDAFEYRRIERDGQPDWDLNSVASPDAILLVALDLAYQPDPQEHVFRFSTRDATHTFELPPWLRGKLDVFRVDGNGLGDVRHTLADGTVTIEDQIDVVGIYVATGDPRLRERLAAERAELIRHEQATRFDPLHDDADLARLRALLPP